MRIETILDAMLLTADADKFLSHSPSRYLRAQRQYNAFRSRILRMFEEKDAELEGEALYADEYVRNWLDANQRIAGAKKIATEAMTRTTCDWEWNTANDIVKALDGEGVE